MTQPNPTLFQHLNGELKQRITSLHFKTLQAGVSTSQFYAENSYHYDEIDLFIPSSPH